MSIFVRIWFFFSLVLLLGSFLLINTLQQQIRPSMRQVVEDTLADNANLIASLIANQVNTGQINQPEFNAAVQGALSRSLEAQIWQTNKKHIHQLIYITDAKGIVIYDSTGKNVGKDFSKWNDVYLTLSGRYGARSTRSNAQDPNSSIMYVAAPIIADGKLIGVVSLGKPNNTAQPYIDKTQHDMLLRASLMVLITLIMASLVAYWLRHSIDRVRRYALSLAPTHQAAPHFWSARELNELTTAVGQMREQLEDRAYVEQYINTLTHELKSPLTAIKTSAELLQDDLPLLDQQYFAKNINEQAERLHQLIERLLLMAKLEKQQQQFDLSHLNLATLLKQLLEQRQSQILVKKLQIINLIEHHHLIEADVFWISQALGNILDNALDFTPSGQSIYLWAVPYDDHQLELIIFNEGHFIPDFALDHVFEHYYSLPRTDHGKKSSGIGLTMAKEIIERHQGRISIHNIDCSAMADQKSGVQVSILFSH